MAAKILANLIVRGSGILAMAAVQAYRQALANASKSGVAQETLQNAARRVSKGMTEQEARQILGVSEGTTWEEIVKKYDILFERNAKKGSFYLQSKVHRAKEYLEGVYEANGRVALVVLFEEPAIYYIVQDRVLYVWYSVRQKLVYIASAFHAAITTLLVFLDLGDITAFVFPIKNCLDLHRLDILNDRRRHLNHSVMRN